MRISCLFQDVHADVDTAPELDLVSELGSGPVRDLPPDAFTIHPPEPAA